MRKHKGQLVLKDGRDNPPLIIDERDEIDRQNMPAIKAGIVAFLVMFPGLLLVI